MMESCVYPARKRVYIIQVEHTKQRIIQTPNIYTVGFESPNGLDVGPTIFTNYGDPPLRVNARRKRRMTNRNMT